MAIPWLRLVLSFFLICLDITDWGFFANCGSAFEVKLLFLKIVSDLTENGWFKEILVVAQ